MGNGIGIYIISVSPFIVYGDTGRVIGMFMKFSNVDRG